MQRIMSKPKFTSGEWSVPHFALSKDTCKCDCGYVLSENFMGAIATVHFGPSKEDPQNEGDNPTLEEAKANARLIAAAPLLYAELSRILEVFDGAKIPGEITQTPEGVESIRAALDKATREE